MINDSFDDDDGDGKSMRSSTARLEYKSCVGPAAISVNLAQPFIDDVKLEIHESSNNDDNSLGVILVEVKSSSRMGSSDLFVNKKRIEFLGKELEKLGWGVPSVKYGAGP